MDIKSILPQHDQATAATTTTAATRSDAWPVAWQQMALGGILALSAFLNLFRLSREGDGNLYYAAAVRSMLESWHNFFFVSFDPGGFVTVDKPPLGLWLQTASAEIFGFHGWALLLPQALAGVLSVALLYHLVSRAFGPVAGLIAGLVLALTPITVVTSRNNTMDVTLVLVVLLAAWAVLKAAETGRLGWLLLGAFLVGLGFNVKMLEAYLVLPALYLLYLVASPRRWWMRVGHLALATVVLLAVSLSWAVAVDLTPASQRPYVGSTTDNSELSLAIGYNGLDRVLPGITIFGHSLPGTTQGRGGGFNGAGGGRNFRFGAPTEPNESLLQRLRNLFGDGGGRQTGIPGFGASQPGPLRFISQELGGQISWLLPLALLGLVVAAWQVRRRRRSADPAMTVPVNQDSEMALAPGTTDEVDPGQRRRRQGLILWGAWTLSMLIFFSYTSRFQPYYLVMLAPGIAALVGIGLVALWRGYCASPWLFWLLPVALVGSGLFEYMILADYPDWRGRLAPAIFALLGIAALGLVVWRLLPWPRPHLRLPALLPACLAALGLLGLLLAPTAWAALPVWNGSGGRPYAGPAPSYSGSGAGSRYRGGGGGFAFSQPAAQSVPSVDPTLLSYLEAHQGSDRFLVAVANAQAAEPFILKTGKPVMALGGFLGSDPILTPNHLAQLVADGTVRYFLLSGVPTLGSTTGRGGRGGFGGIFGFGGNQQASDLSWVGQHCATVPTAQWQSPNGSSSGSGGFGGFGRGGGQQLFDCGTPPNPIAPTAVVPSTTS